MDHATHGHKDQVFEGKFCKDKANGISRKKIGLNQQPHRVGSCTFSYKVDSNLWGHRVRLNMRVSNVRGPYQKRPIEYSQVLCGCFHPKKKSMVAIYMKSFVMSCTVDLLLSFFDHKKSILRCDLCSVARLPHEIPIYNAILWETMLLREFGCCLFLCLILTGLTLLDLLNIVIMPKSSREEQRTVIKFLVAEDHTPIQIWNRLQNVYGEEALGKTQVRMWCRRFKEGDGHEPVSDLPRSGRPKIAIVQRTIDRVQEELDTDRRVSIRRIVENTGFSQGTVYRILTKHLQVRRLSCKFVPKILTTEQRRQRVDLCTQNLATLAADPLFLDKLVTGDESWLHRYDPDCKKTSSHWLPKGERKRPQKALCARTVQKCMMVAFFDCRGLIHLDFGNRTINAVRYGAVLDRLKDSIRHKRPGLWQPNPVHPHLTNVCFHHDNARPHTANATAVKLADYQWVPHPPYSPDLAPCDFFLFPFLKKHMRGIQFDSVADAQAEAKRILRNTPEEIFRKAITEDLPAHW